VSIKSEMNPMPSGEKVNINEHFGFGFLKNGNPTGNYLNAPRCNAKAKRTGLACRQPAMANGKCRMHGGLSTGPKTVEGLARSKKANWKHGFFNAESKALSEQLRHEYQAMQAFLRLSNQSF